MKIRSFSEMAFDKMLLWDPFHRGVVLNQADVKNLLSGQPVDKAGRVFQEYLNYLTTHARQTSFVATVGDALEGSVYMVARLVGLVAIQVLVAPAGVVYNFGMMSAHSSVYLYHLIRQVINDMIMSLDISKDQKVHEWQKIEAYLEALKTDFWVSPAGLALKVGRVCVGLAPLAFLITMICSLGAFFHPFS